MKVKTSSKNSSGDNCVFCKIIFEKSPATFIYRDPLCSAFLDIQPVNPGHALVIPNKHATYLADLDPDDGAHMFRIGQRIAAALRKSGIRCEGINLFLADGKAAMQEIFHVHLHIIPRYSGDGFGLKFAPSYYQKPDRAELEEIGQKLRAVIKN